MVSFIFEQSGTPFPPGGLILVTRHPEINAILNWTHCEHYKFYAACWLPVASWGCFNGFMVKLNFMFHESGVFI